MANAQAQAAGINWTMIAAIAACAYTLLFLTSMVIIIRQLYEQKRARDLTTVLAILKELQTLDAHTARQYTLTNLPPTLETVKDNELKEHLERARPVWLSYQFAGLLITEQYLDRRACEAILSYTWEGAWKCWKKSETLINYERNRRREKGYYKKFEMYYRLCEKYRIDNGYDEPIV